MSMQLASSFFSVVMIVKGVRSEEEISICKYA